MTRSGDKAVGNWLLLLAAMVFGMVVGGGHARTIGAGFTIQVWRPFTGFIPPLNAADWNQLFGLYQHTAQDMAHPLTLSAYKALFWPMFIDRCWGRLIALVFLLPFVWFWRAGRLSRALQLWLGGIFAAGVGQATYGWYMVQTGMYPGVTSVPPGWLAPHLLSAMLVLAALIWTGLSLRQPEPERIAGAGFLRPWVNASIALVWCTMGFGALVAATNAITVFNSFPLMDGHLVPPGMWNLHPFWVNFVANQGTVQFFHRLIATVTALTVLTTAVLGLRAELPPGVRDRFLLLALFVSVQYLLGMATIVLGAVELGYVHELNAVLLFATAIATRHGLRGAVGGQRVTAPLAAQGAE